MTTTTERPGTSEPHRDIAKPRLTAAEIRALDPYQLMAELGKTVIHPGGGRSTRELLDTARIRPTYRVLDAGCGIGSTAAQITRRNGCHVVAVDIKDANCARARATVVQHGVGDRVEIGRGDIEQLEFDDETFDVVIVEAVTIFVHRKRAPRRWCASAAAADAWSTMSSSGEGRHPPAPASCSWSRCAPGSSSTQKPTGPGSTATLASAICRR
jgi:SAM-dependent methyltransferase